MIQSKKISTQRKTSFNESKEQKVTLIILIVLAIVSISGFGYLLLKRLKKEPQTEIQNSSTQVIETTTTSLYNNTTTTSLISENKKNDLTFDVTNFSKNDQQVGNEKNTEAILTKISNEQNEKFNRIKLEFIGDSLFPKTTVQLVTSSNLILLKIYNLKADSSNIKAGSSMPLQNSVVASIYHDTQVDPSYSKYSVGIKKPTSFFLHEDLSSKSIFLDILEVEADYTIQEEFSFSKNPQSISGNATGNVIYFNGISYSNQGTVFRILFRLGSLGSGTIPAATGEIIDYEGGKAIKIVVSNISNGYFDGYDAKYNDKAVSGMTCSYSNNKYTFIIKTNGEREYKLYYNLAPSQLIIDVKR